MPEEPSAILDEVTEDTLLNGRVRLLQPRRGHRAGTDAVLLAAALEPRAGDTVVDLGAGSGAVGLIMAAAEGVRVVFVERDPALAELCRRNVALNGLGERARVVEADVLAPDGRSAVLAQGSADVVVTNPPFLDAGRSRPSPDPLRAAAHHMPPAALGPWLAAAAELLGPKGRLALIHRADGLADCLGHLAPSFGGVVVRAVHPRADAAAIRVVVTAVKGSRAPLRIAPPLVLHAGDGRFTPEAEALHGSPSRSLTGP